MNPLNSIGARTKVTMFQFLTQFFGVQKKVADEVLATPKTCKLTVRTCKEAFPKKKLIFQPQYFRLVSGRLDALPTMVEKKNSRQQLWSKLVLFCVISPGPWRIFATPNKYCSPLKCPPHHLQLIRLMVPKSQGQPPVGWLFHPINNGDNHHPWWLAGFCPSTVYPKKTSKMDLLGGSHP